MLSKPHELEECVEVDDLVSGAEGISNPEFSEGMAFIWLGSDTGLGPNGTLFNADWEAESDQAYARLGSSTASGDLNGDGLDEIIIGSDGYDHPENDEGMLFVWQMASSILEPQPLDPVLPSILLQVSPNPISSSAKVTYAFQRQAEHADFIPIIMEIYDMSGRLVRVLVNRSVQTGHSGDIYLNANELSTGVYFIKLKAGDARLTKKVTVLK